jgi:hypothetical protein
VIAGIGVVAIGAGYLVGRELAVADPVVQGRLAPDRALGVRW